MSDLDKIFKAYDVRGVVPDELDESVAEAVGAAFVRLTGTKTIVTLHDMRASSGPLADAIGRGAMSQGADVIRGGLGSTDMVYYAAGLLEIPGAMVTASHNPARYNGVKLCKAGAKPVGIETGLAEIKAMVESGVPAYDGKPGTSTDRDLLPDYADYLKKLVDISGIRPLKVVVDAGNGMGGYTVPTVFEGLPITLVPLYFELDGSFPNHEANPIDPANLRDLQRAVKEHKADIGLAFDGDADRCFIVDERGEIVSPSTLTGLIATRELAREPGAAVIHNLITSRAVPELVAEHGGTPVRTRVGHSFIKAKMSDNNAIFGGEHSGHFYFRDFWFADSGMLAALHALAALGHDTRPLSVILSEFSRYADSGEINSEVSDQAAATAKIKTLYSERSGVTLDELDGLTVAGDTWWFNVRPSNTEPLLRLNVEASDEAEVAAIRDEVLGLIRTRLSPGDSHPAWGAPAPHSPGPRTPAACPMKAKMPGMRTSGKKGLRMEIEDWVMEFIICPKCRADLRADDAASELVCTGCGLAYPVRNSIPVLLVDEARQTPVSQLQAQGDAPPVDTGSAG